MNNRLFELTFLRHGESTGNASGVIQGQADMPLNERGRQQAAQLAQRWAAEHVYFDQIIASPLLRARETALIVAARLNLPVQFDPVWMERCFGFLEGLTGEEIHARYPNFIFQHPYQKPGDTGESLTDLFLRASQGVQGLLRMPPARYLVVSHGAILNMVLYAIMGLNPLNYEHGPRFQFGNTGYAQVTYQPNTRLWRFVGFNTPGIATSPDS